MIKRHTSAGNGMDMVVSHKCLLDAHEADAGRMMEVYLARADTAGRTERLTGEES